MRRLRSITTPVATLTLCLSMTVGLAFAVVPSASGDPGGGGHAYPSQDQVDQAKARARRTAGQVGVIKGQLLLANQRLDQADLRAEQASEAYNGAMWRLEEAKTAYRQARADAARAQRTVASQRDRIGELVAQSYQQGGDLTALTAMMSADGPQGLLDQYAGFQGAATSMQADYKRYAASDSLAQVFESKARQAKAEQVRMAAKAATARNQAAAAAASAQAQAAQIGRQKDHLIAALAQAQHISVRLAHQRQTALEEIARKRAEERARRAAIAAAKAAARAEARARAEAAAKQRAAAAEARRKARQQSLQATSSGAGNGSANEGGSTDPAPPPPPPPPAADPPAPSGGVDAAIRFAKAQLGEPYRWGATGPSSWDCSGLTMRAWAAGGRYLPHYSVAQYDAGTPISIGDARPGDLLFWSSNGRPSGIHHVALYLGGGSFIEAPHTGANVRYNSIYAWYPDFAVRL